VSGWPLRSCLQLAALPTAVPCARLHAKHLLWEWGLDKLADHVEVIVSELTTNAVQATVDLDRGERSRRAFVACIEVRLFSDNDRVLIEVWDGNPQPPKARALGVDHIPALDEESGRGLFLVEMLSHEWGYYAARDEQRMTVPVSQSQDLHAVGKVVWAVTEVCGTRTAQLR
jgi:anti-sigma regulatory factor (Ser/Thr protein kinase)